MTAKIIINAFNQEDEKVTLFLDKNVSFIFKDTKIPKKTYFSISGLSGNYYTNDGDCTILINDIEEQISDIITDRTDLT